MERGPEGDLPSEPAGPSELEAILRELDALAYAVAHDLRAPVRAVQGFSRILLGAHAERLDAEGRMLVQRIHAAGRRMDALIQGLLAYSRLTRDEVRLAAVPLEPILDGVLEDLRQTLDERNARVEVERPLPAVHGHPGLLSHTLHHLLSNASKFVAPGTNPRIHVRAAAHSGEVRVLVADEGIGIDPRLHDRLFQVCQRLHNGEYPGTGIGLATVRRAVERMNGRVGVTSALDEGSTFWFEVPAAPVAGKGRGDGR